MAVHKEINSVFVFKFLPFYNVWYKGEYSIATSSLTSLSSTNAITVKLLNNEVYPAINNPLYTEIDT